MSTREMASWLTGGVGLTVFWIVLLIATRKHPWALVIGEDGRPSTSKFQIFVWTAAVVLAFLMNSRHRIGRKNGSGQQN